MWKPGTILPDKGRISEKWKASLVDPEGTILTLTGFDSPEEAKLEMSKQIQRLNDELKELIIDQRRGTYERHDDWIECKIDEEKKELEEFMKTADQLDIEDDWENLTPFQRKCAEGIMRGDIGGRLSNPPT